MVLLHPAPMDQSTQLLDALARIDEELLIAHGRKDQRRLAELYSDAGKLLEQGGEVDRACFFFTQGYVFALDQHLPELVDDLVSRLRGHGREV